MISTNQKRKYIRVGTNLVAKVTSESPSYKDERIVYIKNMSTIGAKIESRSLDAKIGDLMNIKFKYKSVLYDILCKIVRVDSQTNSVGVQFYFKGEDDLRLDDKKRFNSNKNKLYSDIIDEYFRYKDVALS